MLLGLRKIRRWESEQISIGLPIRRKSGHRERHHLASSTNFGRDEERRSNALLCGLPGSRAEAARGLPVIAPNRLGDGTARDRRDACGRTRAGLACLANAVPDSGAGGLVYRPEPWSASPNALLPSHRGHAQAVHAEPIIGPAFMRRESFGSDRTGPLRPIEDRGVTWADVQGRTLHVFATKTGRP